MRRKFTRLKIGLFGLLIIAFIGIQYSWVRSLQKDKLEQFRAAMITGINGVGDQLTDTSIGNILHQAFLTKGFNLRFEYTAALHDRQLTSPGFLQKQGDTANNLILHYILRRTGEKKVASEEMVTVLVPSWKKKALSEMGWIIVGSVLLTGMIMTIFVCAFMLVTPKQPLYDSRTLVIQHMMQKLEAPLSTVSVAADALRNAKVKLDPRQVNYYQQIITEESRRMNEQVEKFLRDIKNS